METLDVDGMIKNHHLAQSINGASWNSFVTKLQYKAEWDGKNILRIGRFHLDSVKVQNAKKCYFLCNISTNSVGKSLYVVFEVVHKIR
jgi:hypothetical protein